VEPNHACCTSIRDNVALNGWTDVRVCNAFVGGDTAWQHDPSIIYDADGVQYSSEDELIDRFELRHVDLLKCDIEGSEFDLVRNWQKLLAMTDRIVMEVHEHAGTIAELTENLRGHGFSIRRSQSPTDVVIWAERRT
jgi:FkbM family methyltransferase